MVIFSNTTINLHPLLSPHPNSVQVYLEVWVNADGKQRSLPCTHGGAGATMEAARDDACLQAMSYLYIFGGFSPSESAEEKK
jgi:hypothetical protein